MSTFATPAPLLTPREVAAHLRVHRASIYRWIDDGRLPAFRLGGEGGPLRIPADAVDAHLRRVAPAAERGSTSVAHPAAGDGAAWRQGKYARYTDDRSATTPTFDHDNPTEEEEMKSSLSVLAGRRITIDMPDDFAPLDSVRNEYEHLQAELRAAQQQLERLATRREEAGAADTAAFAANLRSGKRDPGRPESDRVDKEIVAAQRRRTALERAINDVEAELIALVEAHRTEWLEEVAERLERQQERKRELLMAFAEERAAIVATLSRRRWIEGFPTRPSVRRVGSPPVAMLLGRNGEGLAWETILAALEADLEPVREPRPATLAMPA